jgi:5-methylcytosine-specific restriction endonuclease McrA
LYQIIGIAIAVVIAFMAYHGVLRSYLQIVQLWNEGNTSRFKMGIQIIGFIACSIVFFVLFEIDQVTIISYCAAISIFFAVVGYLGEKNDQLLIEKEQLRRKEENKLRLESGEGWTKNDILEKFQQTIYFRNIGALTPTLGWKCASCGKNLYRRDEASIDHIKPVSKRPELRFTESNLQILCRPCNSTKSAYLGEDWKSVTRSRRRVLKKKKKSEIERPRLQ